MSLGQLFSSQANYQEVDIKDNMRKATDALMKPPIYPIRRFTIKDQEEEISKSEVEEFMAEELQEQLDEEAERSRLDAECNWIIYNLQCQLSACREALSKEEQAISLGTQLCHQAGATNNLDDLDDLEHVEHKAVQQSMYHDVMKSNEQYDKLSAEVTYLEKRIHAAERILPDIHELSKGMVSEAGLLEVRVLNTFDVDGYTYSIGGQTLRQKEVFYDYLMTKWYIIDGKTYIATQVYKVVNNQIASHEDIEAKEKKLQVTIYNTLYGAKRHFLSQKEEANSDVTKIKKLAPIDGIKSISSEFLGVSSVSQNDKIIDNKLFWSSILNQEVTIDGVAHHFAKQYYVDLQDTHSMDDAVKQFLEPQTLDKVSLQELIEENYYRFSPLNELVSRKILRLQNSII